MSRHGSQSPSPRTLTSTGITAGTSSGESDSRHVSSPQGLLEPQSPVVAKFSKCVEKYKTGAFKKGEARFEIYSILVTSGEKAEVVKTTIELYIAILDQHDIK